MEMLLFVILLVAIVFITMPKPGEKGGAQLGDKLDIDKKQCPPHKWEYQEILDHRGISHGQKMVCLLCQSTPGAITGSEE